MDSEASELYIMVELSKGVSEIPIQCLCLM
jgi:hypothetical protein